ncbi:MAG: hypothetical protein LBO05_10560 [Deltaproteobacteria bacterium]|nr:hypothetical protein [Deltaproteobacteria bacterium]
MRDQNDKNDKAVRPASHKCGPTADVRRFDEPAQAEAPNPADGAPDAPGQSSRTRPKKRRPARAT